MKNINTSERIANIFEFHQLLQTIHKKLFSNSLITDQSDQKKVFFVWNNACQKVFNELKKRDIETLILLYFFFKLETFFKLNSFDFVSIKILSQRKDDDLIKSVIYFSKIPSFAKCNYEIYDKNLLILIKCFEQWRNKLQLIELFINVFIEHNNLEYFIIIKKLNR